MEPTTRLRVALVEDSDDDGLLLREDLDDVVGRGLELRQAWTMAEAQALLGEWRPDAVLLDLGLPDSHGLGTLERLLESHPELPVVVLTGDSRPGVGVEAVRAGAQDFLVKGVDSPAQVLRTLRYAIERKRSLELARRREDDFRALFDVAPVGMVLLSDTGEIRRANRRLARDLGEAEEQLAGRRLEDLVAPQDAESARAFLQSVQQGTVHAELRMPRLDGGLETGLWTGTRLGGGSIVAVVENVTWRRQVEAGLQHAQKMEALGRLSGGLAHDFNNLLTAIMGYADLLHAEHSLGHREELQMIMVASRRAAELTQRLLTFARRQVSQVQPLDLGDVVRDLEVVIRGILGERVQLQLELQTEHPWIQADRSWVDQILMNLVLNSRDAMPAGGVVRVVVASETLSAPLASTVMDHVLEPGDHVRLSVIDTGEGMTEEVRRKIFEPFFTTKSPDRGTGLGLSTVYGIVQQARAGLRVETAPGAGTTFHVWFPAGAREPGHAVVGGAPDLPRPGGATILVVEDDPAIRTLVRRILEPVGYRVLLAAEGATALDLARVNPLDLVICDVVMPGMTGPQVARGLAELQPQARILFTSGYTPDPDMRAILGGGTVDFLPKPFSAEDLQEKVRRVLTREGPAA